MFNKHINIDKNTKFKNRVPILYKDPSWNKLFGKTDDRNIQTAKEELMQLVAKEKEMEYEVKKLQSQKSKYMKMILGVSDSVNNENKVENVSLLDEYKERIYNINEELEELKFQLEIIPKDIKETNIKLLNATIQYGYDELKYKQKIVDQSVEEIESLKKRLTEAIDTKHDYDEWINETYTFLHGILGREIIDKIDKERLG
ncbi:hypothetical protein [Tissierella sp.]|uniref:hypothetical protein n=1 Tax=Tissierella sp. TaxID=41274 RepID=UPI002861DCFC|nr:hypothetical protein [Tissierella sp.]MDR7856574.1 hypothetical protein [Tissierella sp.]